jgi:hypothetical protein
MADLRKPNRKCRLTSMRHSERGWRRSVLDGAALVDQTRRTVVPPTVERDVAVRRQRAALVAPFQSNRAGAIDALRLSEQHCGLTVRTNRVVYKNGQRRVDALTYSVQGGHDANETGRAVHLQEVRMQCHSNGSPVGGRQRRPRLTRVLW